MRKIALVMIMLLMCGIAEADNSARIREVQEEKMMMQNRRNSYKEVRWMPLADFQILIRNIETGIFGADSIILELQAQDVEAREIARREKERLEAEKKEAEEKVEQKIKGDENIQVVGDDNIIEPEVAPEAEEPAEEVAPETEEAK